MSQICNQTFTKLLKLKEHVRATHRNLNADGSVHEVLPFRCHVCREVFQQPQVLRQHLASAHNMAGTQQEQQQQQQQQQQHQVSCPACGQGFARHHNLRSHILKVHGQVRAQ